MKLMLRLSLLVVILISMIGMTDCDSLKCAYRHGALAKVAYRVVDDEGIAVSNAMATIWFCFYRNRDNYQCRMKTDENGMFTAEHKANEKVVVVIEKDGYYDSHDTTVLSYSSNDNVLDGKWQPFGIEKKMVLKRIRKPEKMVRGIGPGVNIPMYGKWLGFDFEQNDWVSPYGKGVHSDVLLRFTTEVKHRFLDFKTSLEISFTNNPFAGVYELKKDVYSDMKSVYQADINANYTSTLEFYHEKHPKGKVLKRLEEDRYWVFRTRTQVDPAGRLVSAHYGKIYGRLEFYGGFQTGARYFNPNPNDPNIEDASTADYSKMLRKLENDREEYKKSQRGWR